MNISFRPASIADYAFCERMYVDEARLHDETGDFDPMVVRDGISKRWDAKETRIIQLDGANIGWVQTVIKEGSLFIRQLMVEDSHRGHGAGTAVLQMLIDEARRQGLPVTLGVVKDNPAKALYERFGFRITHDDERKFYMKRDTLS